jgi:hypothetical protein
MQEFRNRLSPEDNINKDIVFHVSLSMHMIEVLQDFVSHVFYRGADKSLAPPTSRYILFDCENSSFDASLFIYINSTNIPLIMVTNKIYENQNLLSL